MDTKIRISSTDKVVVLTGAGISAESGLKTFRDNDGLWENHPVEKVATPQAFANDPVLVWRFYKQRYRQLSEVKPNPGHRALMQLEQQLSDNFVLITQNVDGLHTDAGNKHVLEMHGSLKSCFCTRCNTHYNMADIDLDPEIPVCLNCGSALRPDIVWFGEMPYHLETIDQKLYEVDYFIVVGTSGVVYPAAQFLMIAKHKGAVTVGINLERPQNSYYLDEFHQGRSGDILPGLVEQWIIRG